MNLNEETRNGYVISAEMKKIWSIQLEMVKKVLEVCQKHHLSVWADSGTLIGTVREKGFIPWDDDIDLVMIREDYDKLLEIAPSEFKEPFFFQDTYTDKLYPRGHAQVRYNGTAAILPAELHCKFNQSIFIDIFVLDALPANYDKLAQNINSAEFLRSLLNMRVYSKCNWAKPKSIIKYIGIHLFFGVFSFQKIYTKFVDIYARPKDCVLSDDLSYSTYCLRCTLKYRLKKEWFADTLYMTFEDIMMPVPVGYDALLSHIYGDYMKPVQAPTAHGSVIFDTTRSYTEVLKDIKSGKIDIKQYLYE